MTLDDVDKQIWARVTDVPEVSLVVAIISAILNVFIPGLGTTVTACAAKENVSKTQLMMALVQFFTTYVLVGWVLSIYWGYLIVMKSRNAQNQNMRPAPGGGHGFDDPH
mmetsp:Transcript_31596/g.48305  ORF Transcript_31596/g.48305 Transcript_31596/m.48305 type:complete len:109 (-) Transcript_31596:93-419(-)|eukprot:CAMPEP_0170492450 /NCGR_PEP_ID=MMETSP0208-20121228/12268_1 /TAXON_ID=197538 /ORGANISM="Strombidium inclinatum, Strain S3" /LENGTH=108 /DNA_ID=CAMNT_0010768185 /DNA_START=114 /DNA_END=440 /DNA_ORIENTATION=+